MRDYASPVPQNTPMIREPFFCSVNPKRFDCRRPIDRRAIPATMHKQGEAVSNAGGENMVEDLHRRRVLNFLDAYYSGDVEAAVACCDNDVDSIAHAPIELFPHLGHERG